MGTNGPTITGSAAVHAERIRAAEAARAAAGQERERDGRQTAEIFGERAVAGFRADEALRQAARMTELRARGVISADAEPDDEDGEYEEEVLEVEEETEDDDENVSTAELYARRERARQKAEHAAVLKAHTGSSWALGNQRPPWVA